MGNKTKQSYPAWNEPMYRQLATSLREAITQGAFPDGRLPGERELARRYGVTVIVVKWALDLLSRDGVLHRVPRKGSFVAGAAAGPHSVRPIVYFTMTEHKWHLLRQGGMYAMAYDLIRQKAEASGYDLVGETFPEHGPVSWRFQTLIGNPLLVGAITFPHVRAKKLREMLPSRVHVVALDHCIELTGDAPDPGVSYVLANNLQAGYDLMRVLIERGHRRIVFFGSTDVGYPTADDRIAGGRKALGEIGLDLARPPYLGEAQATEAWWRGVVDEGITAAVAYNDHAALLALNRMHRCGIRAGEDISLACFDDLTPLLSEVTPAISAMAMPVEAMADKAWELLTRPAGPPTRVELPYRFVDRASVITLSAPPSLQASQL